MRLGSCGRSFPSQAVLEAKQAQLGRAETRFAYAKAQYQSADQNLAQFRARHILLITFRDPADREAYRQSAVERLRHQFQLGQLDQAQAAQAGKGARA